MPNTKAYRTGRRAFKEAAIFIKDSWRAENIYENPSNEYDEFEAGFNDAEKDIDPYDVDCFKNHKEAEAFAEQEWRRTTLDKFGVDSLVHIVHGDGSSMFFTHAFLKTKGDWVFVFTEHNGNHVYHYDDLTTYRFYKQTSIDEIET